MQHDINYLSKFTISIMTEKLLLYNRNLRKKFNIPSTIERVDIGKLEFHTVPY